MNIAILGYARQGSAAYDYWNSAENSVTICDRDTTIQIPEGALAKLGDDYLANLDEFDLLVRTPILHPRDIAAANPDNPDILGKVTTVTDEFMRICPSKNTIGVTGTKGKGTTSTLIAKLLEGAGKRVHLGGNIGIPPFDLLNDDIQPDDWVVLELANFQLIDLKHSPKIAACLMVEPEHLDWHEDFEEYIAAKQQLFINQTEDDVAIYYASNVNSVSIADASMGRQIPFMEEPGAFVENDTITIAGQALCKTSELRLLGEHNWQNACAALTAVWQITQDIEALRATLTSFSGLPFRIELRRGVHGVRYYNDSFATGPGATVAALNAVAGHKIPIIGGYERGLDLSELIERLTDDSSDIRKVFIIGQSGDRVVQELEAKGFSNYVQSDSVDMNEIVKSATSFASKGDAVVLSPAFASFDMYKNFEERGIAFNEAVEKL